MTSLLLGVTGVLAVVAIYFLWARKLGAKAPEQANASEPHA
jgi:hypothetical protein